MKKKSLGLFTYALVAVVGIGVGYAAITSVQLTINGSAKATANQDSFSVEFSTETSPTIQSNPSSIASYDDQTNNETTSATVNNNDKTQASFSLYGFSKKDETATVTFTVVNNSTDLKAKLCESDISINSQSEALSNSTFTMAASLPSATVVDTDKCVTLDANGGTTTIQVVTTANATPIQDNQSYQVSDAVVSFSASPVANN